MNPIHFCCFEKNANESQNFKGNALETPAGQVHKKWIYFGQVT
jgi:hypothetical protein